MLNGKFIDKQLYVFLKEEWVAQKYLLFCSPLSLPFHTPFTPVLSPFAEVRSRAVKKARKVIGNREFDRKVN